MLQTEICERARLARDTRFDGRFFTGVKTTGIYCRPVCPAVSPKRENVEYFPTAAAAGEAGFRPCLRCRPECAPGTPAWAGTSTTVRRGLRLIESGALDSSNIEALADRLGVTSRHLRRLFTTHVGASPLAVAHTRRLHFAKRLIDDTTLPMTHIADAAGYGSVRRFNDAFRKVYGRSPRDLRRYCGEDAQPHPNAPLTVRLPYRRPFGWSSALRFHADRATPGIESVSDGCYRRTLALGDTQGLVEVREDKMPGFLSLTLYGVEPGRLFEVIATARDVFDVDAPVAEIAAVLSEDPLLGKLLDGHPGIRVPGAWDGFELTVRAILGQQISVKAATTLAGRIAVRYGEPLRSPYTGGLTHLFPTPAVLCRARFNDIGLVKSRAETLRRVAQAVRDGDIDFDPIQDVGMFHERLTAIRGIGDWTAQYVAMRVLKYPDALPASDLGLLKALDPPNRVSPAALLERAERWRPWRAYAVMLLWNSNPGSGG